jgi:hypothetical protein
MGTLGNAAKNKYIPNPGFILEEHETPSKSVTPAVPGGMS